MPKAKPADPGIVGLISDTHGLLRPEAEEALQGCRLIVHAGDVGSPEILARLKAIAPVVAVRGNVDIDLWASALPETAVAEAGAVRLYVLHDLKQLRVDPATLGFSYVVSGHTHHAAHSARSGVQYINPGSAGPRRFRLPVTLARLHLAPDPPRVEFVQLIS